MKFLVTGASGFIARHVIMAATRHGHDTYALVRSHHGARDIPADRVRVGDLRDPVSLRGALAGMEVIIHLAGLTRAKTQGDFFAVNATGVSHLIEAARAPGSEVRRFVLVSSLSASGPGTPALPRREDDSPAPCTPYGRSKLAGERALRETTGSVSWTIVRPPIVYGPWDRDVLTLFRMAAGAVVPVVGFRDRHYSMVYAPDLAEVLVRIAGLEAAAGHTINVAGGRPYSWLEIVRLIGAALGREPRIVRLPEFTARIVAAAGSLASFFRSRPPLLTLDKLPEVVAPGWVCSVERLHALVGDEACPTDLPAGLRATAEWYRREGWLR